MEILSLPVHYAIQHTSKIKNFAASIHEEKADLLPFFRGGAVPSISMLPSQKQKAAPIER